MNFPPLLNSGRKPERYYKVTVTALRVTAGCTTYENNNEVKASPHTGEIFVQPESKPFQYHFHSKENSEDQVNDLQDEF